MLETITEDGYLKWHCQAREWQDDPPCGVLNSCSLDAAVYQEAPGSKPGEGAVIVLPSCQCGAQLTLKADYSLKELQRALQYVEEGEEAAWVLPLRYVYNLQAHWTLYERGKAAYAPVLERPPQELLTHPAWSSIKPTTVLALWYGYIAGVSREITARTRTAVQDSPGRGLLSHAAGQDSAM